MTGNQKVFLCEAIRNHRNILVSGSVGSGKSTLLNGLIHELTSQFANERLVIIEDTAELQCVAKDFVQYHTTPERNMTDLVRISLRMRPDRILVGEVRGEEALDLLMAWNLGTPGGFATVHANDGKSSLTRIETLVSMHPRAPRDIPRLLGEVQPILVHMARAKGGRIVREILDVCGYSANEYQFRTV
jgi:type IV secretion system protein TrbB